MYLELIAFASSVLCIRLVVFPVRKNWKRAFWLAPMLSLAALSVGCTTFHALIVSDSSPTFLPESKLAGLIKGLPDYARFGYWGLAYYKGKLYASTNVGLVEISRGRPTGVYRFQKSDSVVSGPWLDTSDQLLWVLDAHANQLLNFDGGAWHRINLPQPQKGYLTRGDVLEGPRPIGNATGFWLEDGGSIWRWDPAKGAWIVERQPAPTSPPPSPSASPNVSDTIGVVPIGDQLFFIERHQPLSFLIKNEEDFASDTIIRGDASFDEVPNQTGSKFFAEEWVVAGDSGYVCTKNGSILKVTPEAMTKLDTPGRCETVASTTSGTLLGSFQSTGIYEYSGSWKLLARHPYPSGAGDYWTYLSESGPEIAVAVVGKDVVDKQQSSGTDMKFTQNAPTDLWIYQGSEFHRIQIP